MCIYAFAHYLREHEQQQLLPNVVPDTSEQAGRSTRTSRSRPLSANTIRQRAVKSLDESAKRLKAIEVCAYTMYKLCSYCTHTPLHMLFFYWNVLKG